MSDILKYENMTDTTDSLYKLLDDLDILGCQYTRLDNTHVNIPYIMYNNKRYWISNDVDLVNIKDELVELLLLTGALVETNPVTEFRVDGVKYFENLMYSKMAKSM